MHALQPGKLVLKLPTRRDGRLSWTLVTGYIPRWFTPVWSFVQLWNRLPSPLQQPDVALSQFTIRQLQSLYSVLFCWQNDTHTLRLMCSIIYFNGTFCGKFITKYIVIANCLLGLTAKESEKSIFGEDVNNSLELYFLAHPVGQYRLMLTNTGSIF